MLPWNTSFNWTLDSLESFYGKQNGFGCWIGSQRYYLLEITHDFFKNSLVNANPSENVPFSEPILCPPPLEKCSINLKPRKTSNPVAFKKCYFSRCFPAVWNGSTYGTTPHLMPKLSQSAISQLEAWQCHCKVGHVKTSYKSHVTPFITTPAWGPPALWGKRFFTPWNVHGDFTRLYVAETFAVFKVETSEFDTLNVHAVNFLSGLIFTKTWNSKAKDLNGRKMVKQRLLM